jgi:hypothetical protein
VLTFPQASFSNRIVGANATPNTNSASATAFARRGLRIVTASARTSASTVQIAGHAGTPARGRSSGLAGARRHSSASMDNASVKVSAAIRMRPAIALNVRYHLHTVLERRAGGSRDWMHVSPDARRLAPGPKNCEGPGDAAAGSHLEACVRNDVTEESLFLVTKMAPYFDR